MIWSVVPEEVVFENWDQSFELQEKSFGGRMVRVRVGQNGLGSIEGIISSDPKDYLNKRFAPGREIKL